MQRPPVPPRTEYTLTIIAIDRPGPALAILLAGLVLTGCVETGAPDQVEITGDSAAGITLDRVGPGGAALVVPVHINGQGPYDFVLDTGATMTCIDDALADSMALQEPSGRVGSGMGIGGEQPATMRLVQFDSLRIGEASADELMGCAVDLQQFRAAGVEVHGLVGLNFLSEFLVTLDFERERLTLEQP